MHELSPCSLCGNRLYGLWATVSQRTATLLLRGEGHF